jgi:hypothetical protein
MAFCTNCGTPLDDGAKFCTGCGTPVEDTMQTAVQAVPEYKEIRLLEFWEEKKKLGSSGKGSFKSFALYNKTEGGKMYFRDPERPDDGFAEARLVTDKTFPELKKWQPVIISYTSTGLVNQTLDNLEIPPPPQFPAPPEGYEEIDLFDFKLGHNKQKFEKGRKFCSHARFRTITSDGVGYMFGFMGEDDGFVIMNPATRFPKFTKYQELFIVYTVEAPGYGGISLDDILLPS